MVVLVSVYLGLTVRAIPSHDFTYEMPNIFSMNSRYTHGFC